MKALIIGFGHIGQRHFESIYNYKKLKEIYVYDKEIKKVQEYLKLNKKYKKKLKILDNFSKDKSFFLCIISTNSDVRFEMFKKINNTMRIKNYIFEKIVFQKPTEYEKTYKIIIKNKLNCWINCPRRGWKIYTDIKKKIIKNKKFVMKISGENWGLLSNSIHFIDLFIHLKNIKKYKVSFKKLIKKSFKSKRNNFTEMKGKIIFLSDQKDKLVLEDTKKLKRKDLYIEFIQPKKYISFYQSELKDEYKLPLQSQETIKHLKNLDINKNCKLPLFVKTYQFHKFFYLKFDRYIKTKFSKSYKKILVT